MHKDSQYEQHPDTICPHVLPSTSVWEVQPTYPPPRGATDKGLKRGGSTLLPRASLRSYRERHSALTESVTALLPRAPQRSYNDRFGPLVKGDKPAQSAQPPRGLHPTLSDNIHIRLGGTAYISSSPRCDRQSPQEGVSTLLPRAPQRSYRERPCAPIMIVLALQLRGISQPNQPNLREGYTLPYQIIIT